MSFEGKIVYFDRPGKRNTEEVLRIAKRRAEELGIKTIVIASVTGYTAEKALNFFDGMRVVIVTAHTGFSGPNEQHFSEEVRRKVLSRGWKVLTAPHVFGGLSYAMRDLYGTATLGVDLGNTLRIFGQGMKVVCECPMAAADAGLVNTDEEVISIGGTDQGADTAVVLKPVNVKDFFNLRVKEILCKPRL